MARKDTTNGTVSQDLQDANENFIELYTQQATNTSNISANTSAIAGKQDTINGAATTITDANLTASRALLSNGSGKIEASGITSTELGHLSGTTSNIQTQLIAIESAATKNNDADVSGNSWVLDEDDMTSNSATKLPTQQSVKAYRDNPQVDDQSRYGASAGGTDSYAITLTPAPTSYYEGMVVHFKADVFNNGPCTLNVNSLGDKSIKRPDGSDPATADIRNDHFIALIYNGTHFQMLYDPGPPVGSTIEWLSGDAPPSGYLEHSGDAVSRTTYAELFAVIGVKFGDGDGVTTFNLPNSQGKFHRGWDHGAGVDPDAASRTDRGDGTTGDNNGTNQGHQFKNHNHTLTMSSGSLPNYNRVAAGNATVGGTYTDPVGASGGNETRPVNVNVMYCIKY